MKKMSLVIGLFLFVFMITDNNQAIVDKVKHIKSNSSYYRTTASSAMEAVKRSYKIIHHEEIPTEYINFKKRL